VQRSWLLKQMLAFWMFLIIITSLFAAAVGFAALVIVTSGHNLISTTKKPTEMF
jgi:hypothetical protein